MIPHFFDVESRGKTDLSSRMVELYHSFKKIKIIKIIIFFSVLYIWEQLWNNNKKEGHTSFLNGKNIYVSFSFYDNDTYIYVLLTTTRITYIINNLLYYYFFFQFRNFLCGVWGVGCLWVLVGWWWGDDCVCEWMWWLVVSLVCLPSFILSSKKNISY